MTWQTLLIVIGCPVLGIPAGILLGRILAKKLYGKMVPDAYQTSINQLKDQKMPERAADSTLAHAAENFRIAKEAIAKSSLAMETEARQTGHVASYPLLGPNINTSFPPITEKTIVMPTKAENFTIAGSDKVTTQSVKRSAKFYRITDEMRQNLEIARMPRPEEPVPFKIEVINLEMEELKNLPLDVTNDIKEVYTDINLANNIVWLSQVVINKNKDLETSYVRLCGKIADRLTRILARVNDPKLEASTSKF